MSDKNNEMEMFSPEEMLSPFEAIKETDAEGREWEHTGTVPVCMYNNNVMRIRFVNTINPVFIAYSFLADYTKDQLEKIKSGTTNVWAIYYRDLSKILITYLSSSEQQSIVATLDSLKSKVNKLQANYDKISQECDALKQAILRQVFE